MRRLALPLLVAVMALLPAAAWGASDVIGNSGNEFDKATYYADQGDLVKYKHSGRAPHNVVSTQRSGGKPLFESATISDGMTPVNGTELLVPGTYPFECTIHGGMEAELVIRSKTPPGGEPPPPSGDGPPPSGDSPPPSGDPPTGGDATLDGSASAKKKQKQKGKKIVVEVKVKASENLEAEVSGQIKVNPTYKLKTQTKSVGENTKETLKLKPKRKHAEKIAKAMKKGKKAQAKVTVKLGDEAGNAETTKLKVKLKR